MNNDTEMKRRRLEKLEAEWADLLAGLKTWTDDLRRHRGFCPDCGEPMIRVVGRARWQCEECNIWWFAYDEKYAKLYEMSMEELERHKGIDSWSEEGWKAWRKGLSGASMPKIIKMMSVIIDALEEKIGD